VNIQQRDPNLLAAAYTDLLTAAYSHPAVQGFVLWGFWQNAIYRNNSAIVDNNWTLTPAGQQLLALVDSWATRTMVTTASDGTATVRATLGSYALQAQLPDGTAVSTTFDVDAATTSEPRLVRLAVNATPSWTVPGDVHISSTVIHANPGAFSFTSYDTPYNSWLNGGAFEPFMFRTKLLATATAASTISASQSSIDGYNVWKEGLMDGANARVYRIVNGTFRLIRNDTVPVGGYRASGWSTANALTTLVAANCTVFSEYFDAWWRAGVPYYYAVLAVDVNGVESAASNAVAVNRSVVTGRPAGLVNTLLATSAPSPPNPLPAGTVPLPAPTNFRLVSADPTTGMLTFGWTAVSSAQLLGYRVVRSDYAPAQQRGFGVDLATTPSDPWLYVQVQIFTYTVVRCDLIHCLPCP